MVWYNRFLFNFLDCNINNIMGEYIMKITYHKRYLPVDDDFLTNCCTSSFSYPGWPDSDICNKCGEHADISEEE